MRPSPWPSEWERHPVRTEFGSYIIQVTDVRGGSWMQRSPTCATRSRRRTAFAEAENLYFDYAERLAQSAYENSPA